MAITATLLLNFLLLQAATKPWPRPVKNIVLVHGAFVDGSGWKPVADILEHDGYTVFVVQEPETTFAADIAATRIVLDRSGACVLVGHSYGGMIISEVGVHPAVRSLVYVAAFEPEVGETAGGLQNKTPPASNANTVKELDNRTASSADFAVANETLPLWWIKSLTMVLWWSIATQR